MLSFIRQIVLVPAFILGTGNNGYALWLVLLTIVLLINALSVGYLHYSSNLINITYHKEGHMGKLTSLVINTALLFIMVQVILGLVLSWPPLLSLLTNFDVGYLTANKASVAFLLLLAGKLFYLYSSSFFVRLFEPLGNIRLTLKLQAAIEGADLLATALAIYFTGSIFITCLAVFAVNAVSCILVAWYVKRKVTFFSWDFQFNIRASKAYLRSSAILNLSFLIEKVYETGLNLFVANAFGTAIVPVFSTSRTMINIFYRASYTILLPLYPDIQKEFAKNNLAFVIKTMNRYWSISISVIIFFITVGLPAIPYVYMWWTKASLHFNLNIVGFLLMAILFQNFAVVVSEFFKKTNFSSELLVYNIIKSGLTILAISYFGSRGYHAGLGLALALGEGCSTLYLTGMLLRRLKHIYNIFAYMLQVVAFCAILSVYLFTGNYVIFLALSISLLLFMAFRSYYLKEKQNGVD